MKTTNQQKIQDTTDFWDVKKAGERLLWRFGLDKAFIPNADDKLALKSVLAWINRQSSGVFENHNCFAKLYIMQLVGDIRENGTTVFNETVFTELSHKLSKPLELYYTTFYEDLCANQLNKITEKNISDADAQEFVLDYKRFKETFPLDLVKSKLKEQMTVILDRRS